MTSALTVATTTGTWASSDSTGDAIQLRDRFRLTGVSRSRWGPARRGHGTAGCSGSPMTGRWRNSGRCAGWQPQVAGGYEGGGLSQLVASASRCREGSTTEGCRSPFHQPDMTQYVFPDSIQKRPTVVPRSCVCCWGGVDSKVSSWLLAGLREVAGAGVPELRWALERCCSEPSGLRPGYGHGCTRCSSPSCAVRTPWTSPGQRSTAPTYGR